MDKTYSERTRSLIIGLGATAISAALVFGAPASQMAFAADGAPVQAAQAVNVQAGATSGTLASGHTWAIEGGTLTIKGAGDMDLRGEDAPWLAGKDELGNSLMETTSFSKVVIGEGVTNIPSSAFENVQTLSSVHIPGTVTSIGANAFKFCKDLKSIEIPDSVTTIGNTVFFDCDQLADVKLPARITAIGSSMFSGCTSLARIELPARVTSIGQNAFKGCTNLADITFPQGLEVIGGWSFQNCASLTSIAIPSSVKSIGMCAFQNCAKLETVNFEGEKPEIADSAFNGTPYLDNQIDEAGFVIVDGVLNKYNGSDVAEVVVPSTVTKIAMRAFAGHVEITKVTIPESVTEIGNFAFEKCANLKTVVFESMRAPMVKSGIVNECDENVELEILEGAQGYIAGTEGFEAIDTNKPYEQWNYWETYADIVGTRAQLDERATARENAREAAQDVQAAIEGLPGVEQVRLSHRDAVEKAKADFDGLGSEGQKLVSSSAKAKLNEVYAQLQVIIAALGKDGLAVTDALFPDYALRSVVLYDIDKDRNEKLDDAEIAGASSLDLAGGWRDSADAPLRKVNDLKGMETFTSLVELDASNNEIARVDLSPFKDLQELNLSKNGLAQLDVLCNPDLSTLDVSDNKIETIALGELNYLEHLDVSGNALVALNLGDIDPITFEAGGQKRAVSYSGSTLNMKSLDPSFDGARVSGLLGAKLAGTTLSAIGSKVTYSYDCGSGRMMDVELSMTKVQPATAASVAPAVKLAKPALTKKTKSTKKGEVTVAWKKVAGAAGYQVKVGKKTYTVKGAAKLKKTVKAKKGKKVKVRVRAFATSGGKIVYSAWSKAKAVKVKKK